MSTLKASLIVSVYKNVGALAVIMEALQQQTETAFEIIISEDGSDPSLRRFLQQDASNNIKIQHLTQEDKGFRKNKALNQAIKYAHSNYLIFIDGDCVPHPKFIENHIQSAKLAQVCSGRRAELGPRLSKMLLTRPHVFSFFSHPIGLFFFAPFAVFDHAKNYEAGIYSKSLNRLIKKKSRGLVGCNFSCYKKDLLAINGFNEDYVFPGDGEDSDIEWRLKKKGVQTKSIKFLAPVYHLFHQTKYQPSSQNKAILEKTIKLNQIVCHNGLQKLEIIKREKPNHLL